MLPLRCARRSTSRTCCTRRRRIHKADTKARAREGMEQFADAWEDDEPEAVETLWSDPDASVAYLSDRDLTELLRF